MGYKPSEVRVVNDQFSGHGKTIEVAMVRFCYCGLSFGKPLENYEDVETVGLFATGEIKPSSIHIKNTKFLDCYGKPTPYIFMTIGNVEFVTLAGWSRDIRLAKGIAIENNIPITIDSDVETRN